jgi:hypothetical protein
MQKAKRLHTQPLYRSSKDAMKVPGLSRVLSSGGGRVAAHGPSAGLVSLHQREAQRLLWQLFFGRALRRGKASRSGWWKTARPAGIGERTSNRLSAAGKTLGHVLPGIYACFGTAGRSGAVATASSGGLATVGSDVLLKGEFCLFRFEASLVRNLLKALVLLFRRGSHSPTQLLHGLGERSCSLLIFSY